MKRVDGKTCIVTGGVEGIGRACARRLGEHGARIAIFDLHTERGEAFCEALGGAGIEARFWKVDVGDENTVAAAVAEVASQFGSIDVLVNNAGIAGTTKPTHEVSEEEWDRVQRVNVKGVFFCTKHAVPHMFERGGSIINLSSIYGLVGGPDVPPYHASKGAVRLMSKTDAMLYASKAIRVNSIHPGYIWTPMVEQHLRDSGIEVALGRKQLAALHPLGRIGDPDDIAWCVVYLASDESRFVTGAEFVIDGGYTAH